MVKDKFVMYSKSQINDENTNVSESAILGMFKTPQDLHGEKRVLKFMSKCIKLIELTTNDEIYKFCDEEDFEDQIRSEVDFYQFAVTVGSSQIEYVFQIQKLFKF